MLKIGLGIIRNLSSGTSTPAVEYNIQLENSFFLFLEDGSNILIEN